MKGSITKYTVRSSRRPKWRYRLCVGKDSAGKYLYTGRGGFAKEGEARDAMRRRIAEIQVERNAPAQLAAPEITLTDWLEKWLKTYAVERCQPKTRERYEQLASYIIKSDNGDVAKIATMPISALKHAAMESALLALLRQPGKRRAHISARTVHHISGVLSVALNEAFRLDLIALNPMLRVRLPRVEKKQAFSLTEDQVRALRRTCQGDWTFVFVEITGATGARRGEVLALFWTDIDWIAETVTIRRSLEQTRDGGLRLKCTKGEKERTVALGPSAIASLQFLRDQQAEQKKLFGGDYNDQGLVFAQPNGDFLDPALVSQTVIRRMRKAGIKTGSLHSLRHTNASHSLSRGVPLPTVSKRLGHADPSITLRIYSHALPEDDHRAAAAWEGVIQAVDRSENITGDPKIQ
jgi:integrase